MTAKELRVLYSAIQNAKTVLGQLGCDNWPYSEFDTPELRKMYYDLNQMTIDIAAMENRISSEEQSDD